MPSCSFVDLRDNPICDTGGYACAYEALTQVLQLNQCMVNITGCNVFQKESMPFISAIPPMRWLGSYGFLHLTYVEVDGGD
jgi:hypothetical protein